MSYGAVVTEAEVDVLTGDWRILRADILLDCGKSLNPAIDVGQVQGGYVMGLGNFLCEEMLYDDRGKNVSDTSWEYKASPDVRHVPSTDVYDLKPFVDLSRIANWYWRTGRLGEHGKPRRPPELVKVRLLWFSSV
jgi:xanthine dehydrogenase molybdopterin-binding subunit B